MAPSAASTRPCTTPAASPALLIDTSILYSVVNHTSAHAEPVARAAMPQPAADMAGNESVVRGSLHVHGHESIHPSIIGNTSRCRKKRIRHTPPSPPESTLPTNHPSKHNIRNARRWQHARRRGKLGSDGLNPKSTSSRCRLLRPAPRNCRLSHPQPRSGHDANSGWDHAHMSRFFFPHLSCHLVR